MQRHLAFVHSPLSLIQDREIVAAYRGWHAYEKGQGGPSIIDFDLSDIMEASYFSSREEILLTLENLYQQIPDRSEEGEFLRAKLLGSIFYLRALMEQPIPFEEYLQHTLGIPPEYFPDEEIDNVRNKVNYFLARFGLQLQEEYREEFEARFLIHDPEEIKRGIVKNQEFWLAHLRKRGIPAPEKLHLRVEYTTVDAYWSNWTSGSLVEGIKLRINLHSRKKYDLGKPLALCLHEICGHAVQMTIWRELIAKGAIHQACGLTTVHSPEMFIAEGLGQTVPDLLGEEEDFPFEFRLSRWLHYYTLMILHNAHLMIYQGVPRKEILFYARENLPFSSPDVLEAEVRDRSTNPLNRTYQLSYAAAEYTIRGLIHNFTLQQKQRFFFEMYTKPMTPTQLQRFARRLKE